MRLIDISTFVLLARLKHFARVAEELNTSQPAISMRLAALENELGCSLAHRGSGQFVLTPEGEQTLAAFETVLAEIDGLRGALGSHAGNAPAVLRIGAIDTVSSTFLPQMVDELHRRMPRLKVDLTIEGTKALAKGMERGSYDLVFALDPVLGESYRSFVIAMFAMSWVGSTQAIDPSHSYSVEELAELPIVTFPVGTPPFRMFAGYFQDEKILASKLTSSNSLFSIISLVINGFGIGALPTVTVRRELDAGLLHDISTAKPLDPMPIVVTYQTATHASTIREAIDCARVSARTYCQAIGQTLAWTA